MTPRRRPSIDVLERMAGHVLYEKRMWDWAVAQLVAITEDSPHHNALVEIFHLHTRALTEFFRCRPHSDDIVASDDVPDWSTGGDLNFLVDALESINKRWGHISTYRLDRDGLRDDAARWSNNVHHLTLIWDRFIRALPAERRGWFDDETLRLPSYR
jgi:hypothetical protein